MCVQESRSWLLPGEVLQFLGCVLSPRPLVFHGDILLHQASDLAVWKFIIDAFFCLSSWNSREGGLWGFQAVSHSDLDLSSFSKVAVSGAHRPWLATEYPVKDVTFNISALFLYDF